VQQWSAEYVAAIAVTVALAAIAIAGARRWGGAWTRAFGRALALVILAGFVCEQVTYALRGLWSAQVNLPLQLSDAVSLTAIAALWRPELALLVELVYFWSGSASVCWKTTYDEDTSAMPAPIVPRPTTPTFWNSRAILLSFCRSY